jgi:hypothetical protein
VEAGLQDREVQSALPSRRACTTAWGPGVWKSIRRASQSSPDPKLRTDARADGEPPRSLQVVEPAVVALRTATPPGSRPSKISALALGDAGLAVGEALDMHRSDGGDQRRVGRTIRDRGPISSAWFMPISNTARSVSRGIRARVSGTPMWLL